MLFNKIFGAILAVLLAILGLQTFGDIAFGKGGHHGGHHDEVELSLNERLAKTFAYYAEIEETGGADGADEQVFDLGALLAVADVDSGARSFRSKCASCHTIDEGGANGTGPNLHVVVGHPVAAHEGFSYSSAMRGYVDVSPDWSYEALNAFLENPKGTISGTAMAFAGLRKEPERMNVIAYLASVNPGAPAFPAPLEATPDDSADGDMTDDVTDGSDVLDDVADLVEDAADIVDDLTTETDEQGDEE